MNTDIRIAVSFLGHRKRKKLQRKLGPGAVLCLIDLWIVAAMNKPDGILVGMDVEDIALDAGWEGDGQEFVDALIEIGFLDEEDGCYVLHDWQEHNSFAAKADERKSVARNAANARWKKKRGVTESGIADDEEEQCSEKERSEEGDSEQCTTDASAMLVHAESNAEAGKQQCPNSNSNSNSNSKKENTLCDRTESPQAKARAEPAPAGAVNAKKKSNFCSESFEEFWDAFADKRGRTPAWNAWRKIKGLNRELADRIIAGAKRYASQRQAILSRKGTPKMAQGWLSDRRWEDEDDAAVTVASVPVMSKDLGDAFSRVLEGDDGRL